MYHLRHVLSWRIMLRSWHCVKYSRIRVLPDSHIPVVEQYENIRVRENPHSRNAVQIFLIQTNPLTSTSVKSWWVVAHDRWCIFQPVLSMIWRGLGLNPRSILTYQYSPITQLAIIASFQSLRLLKGWTRLIKKCIYHLMKINIFLYIAISLWS